MFNWIFTTVFIMEAGLKLAALRQHYFLKAWNVFDFVIVITSIIGECKHLSENNLEKSEILVNFKGAPSRYLSYFDHRQNYLEIKGNHKIIL